MIAFDIGEGILNILQKFSSIDWYNWRSDMRIYLFEQNLFSKNDRDNIILEVPKYCPKYYKKNATMILSIFDLTIIFCLFLEKFYTDLRYHFYDHVTN